MAGIHIDVEYLGNLRTQATHGPSGAVLRTAAPVDNEGDGSSFSPTDLLATALGACTVTVMAIAARKHGVDLAGATVSVTKQMSSDPPRRVARLPLTITLPRAVPGELRERLELAALQCPVMKSLHPDLAAPIQFVWPAEETQ